MQEIVEEYGVAAVLLVAGIAVIQVMAQLLEVIGTGGI